MKKRVTKNTGNSVLKTLSDRSVKKTVKETIEKNERSKKRAHQKITAARRLSTEEKKDKVIERVLNNIFFGQEDFKEIIAEKEVVKNKPTVKISKKYRGIEVKKSGDYTSPFLVDLKTIKPIQKELLVKNDEKITIDTWQNNEFTKPISASSKIRSGIEEFKKLFSKKTEGIENVLREKVESSVDFTLSKRKKLKKLNYFKKSLFSELFIVNIFQLLGLVICEIVKKLFAPLSWCKNCFLFIGEKVSPLVPIRITSPKTDFRNLLNDYKEIKLSPIGISSPNLLRGEKTYRLPTNTKVKTFFPENWSRALASFTAVSLIFAIPFPAVTYYQKLQNTKEEVINTSLQAFEQFKSGSLLLSEYQLNEAKEEFRLANQGFSQAKNEVEEINSLVTGLIKIVPETNEAFTTGQALINIGQHLSMTAQYLTDGLKPFNPNYSEEELNLTEKLEILKNNLEPTLPEITQVKENLANVELKFIPKDKQSLFEKVKQNITPLEGSLSRLLSVSDSLLKMIGEKQTKRYLVLFQNDSEIRPTGGFIGSFALADIDRGEIENIEIPGGGSYDLKGGLKEKVISPEPLHLINPHWQFHDANWFPDFPTSAQKLIWFYEKSGGPTVDGVITITASMFEELLEIIGPVEMTEYGKTIDSENFFEETQKAVEIEYDKEENKPKQFIADMAPKALDKILNSDKDQLLKIIPLLSEGLEKKHILFYFTDPGFQGTISSYGWSGEIKETKKDYLSVVSTNIAGQKTDLVVKEKIEHKAKIEEDGSITDTVIITKTHEGIKNELFNGVRNVDYVRVYVPEGSTLIEARGFEIPPEDLFKNPSEEYKPDLDLQVIQGDVIIDKKSGTRINNEFGKTVFGNWMQVDPGKTVVASLKYKLPFKLPLDKFKKDKNWLEKLEKQLELNPENVLYSLLVQKQLGSQDNNFSSTIELPKNLELYWKYPSNLAAIYDNKLLSYNTKLEKDKFIALILELK